MSNDVVNKPRLRKFIIAIATAMLILAAIFGAKYRSYTFTVVWHWMHSSNVEIAGHKISLPTLWWKEKAEDYDTYLFRRACSSAIFPPPGIIVRPAPPRVVQQSDQDVLSSLQMLIAARQKDPVAGTSSSLVVLHTRRFPLYCEKIDTKVLGVDLTSHLSCEAARLSHTFTYDGSPHYEQEAESILSTLD